MVIPLFVALPLCVAGLVLFGVATVLMNKRIGSAVDPLKDAGLSVGERKSIDMAILLRRVPDDSRERGRADARAEYVTGIEPVRLQWMLLVYLGFFLALFGLDWVPIASICIEIVQVLVVVVGLNSTFAGWRMVRFCREFVDRRAA
jgi:hypothetical protein